MKTSSSETHNVSIELTAEELIAAIKAKADRTKVLEGYELLDGWVADERTRMVTRFGAPVSIRMTFSKTVAQP